MGNFDLKKYLVENKLTTSSQKLFKEEIYNTVIRKFNSNTDFKTIFNNLSLVFPTTGMSNKEILNEILPINNDTSIVIEVNGELAGFYFMRPKNIPEEINPELYKSLKNLSGIEGVALGVFPKYKNKGIGKKLIEYPKTMGYDYIWGYQYESLNNLKDWLKRRKYYGFDKVENAHITYQIFN